MDDMWVLPNYLPKDHLHLTFSSNSHFSNPCCSGTVWLWQDPFDQTLLNQRHPGPWASIRWSCCWPHTIMHSRPYDFTTVLTVYLEWTEPHFFLRLSMNPRDVENTHTWNSTSLGPNFLSQNTFMKALKQLGSGLVSCLWMQYCT